MMTKDVSQSYLAQCTVLQVTMVISHCPQYQQPAPCIYTNTASVHFYINWGMMKLFSFTFTVKNLFHCIQYMVGFVITLRYIMSWQLLTNWKFKIILIWQASFMHCLLHVTSLIKYYMKKKIPLGGWAVSRVRSVCNTSVDTLTSLPTSMTSTNRSRSSRTITPNEALVCKNFIVYYA